MFSKLQTYMRDRMYYFEAMWFNIKLLIYTEINFRTSKTSFVRSIWCSFHLAPFKDTRTCSLYIALGSLNVLST